MSEKFILGHCPKCLSKELTVSDDKVFCTKYKNWEWLDLAFDSAWNMCAVHTVDTVPLLKVSDFKREK